MLLFGLCVLFVFCVIFISLFKHKELRIVLSIISSFFWCIQLSSVYIGESFVDYKYYRHINMETLAMVPAFKLEAILFVCLLIGLPVLFFYCASGIRSLCQSIKKPVSVIIKVAVLVTMASILVFPKASMYDKFSEIISIVTVTSDSENELSRMLTPKDRLNVSHCSGKNIIILSLESFEKAFLLHENEHLTPYLRQRAQSWNFYDMTPSSGTSFTIASLYTVFTGIPSYFAGHGNNYFIGSTHSKLISLADIVKRCGYQTYHLSNNAEFAGTKELLTALGVEHILDGTFGGKYEESPMSGAYDMDLFAEAKKIALQNKQNPFLLFLATTQTHRPNGVVDQRMLNYITPGKDNLETAAKSTDYLIEDFILFLEQEKLIENTVIYIFPDHAFWGEKPLLDRTGNRYALWMMTNADNLQMNTKRFGQIDLPKIILQGADIRHNAVFLTDLIDSTQDKNQFIEKHIKEITALNSLSMTRDNSLRNSLVVQKKLGNIVCYIDGKPIYQEKARRLKNKHLIIPFDENLKYKTPLVYTNEELAVEFFEPCETYIDIHYSKKMFNFSWIRDNERTYRSSEPSDCIELQTEDIITILAQITPGTNALLNTPEPIEKQRLLTQDTTRFQGCVLDYLPQIASNPNNLLLISAFDEASLLFPAIKPALQTLGLKESLSADKQFRWAYIAALTRDSVYVEKTRHSVLHKKLAINGNHISLTSCGLDHITPTITSRILINDREYFLPRRGLNFIVYDLSTQKVTDAFNVDTYGDNTLTVKR